MHTSSPYEHTLTPPWINLPHPMKSNVSVCNHTQCSKVYTATNYSYGGVTMAPAVCAAFDGYFKPQIYSCTREKFPWDHWNNIKVLFYEYLIIKIFIFYLSSINAHNYGLRRRNLQSRNWTIQYRKHENGLGQPFALWITTHLGCVLQFRSQH